MNSKRGYFYGVASYVIWGLLPMYWRLLQDVPAPEILCHRVVWSFFFLFLATFALGSSLKVLEILARPSTAGSAAVASLLIASNWLVYIWAINAGHALEASLGYFISPLLSIALGFVFLKERLRALQWIAIGLGTTAVLYLTLQLDRFPWIALTLALSFSVYGFVRKVVSYGAMEGLMVETVLLAPLALAYLVSLPGGGNIIEADPLTQLTLVGAGIITVAPLLFFAGAVRRLPMQTIGFLQYISPICQFLVAVFVFGEPFVGHKAVGFTLVWLATVVYLFEQWRFSRNQIRKVLLE